MPWMANNLEGYHALCRLWSSAGFKAKSEKNRRNRGRQGLHRYGGDGHLRKVKRMVNYRISNCYLLYIYVFYNVAL